MSDSTKGYVGPLAAALGAALFGFLVGARVSVGNHGAKIVVMPIGGDLVVVLPPSAAAPSAAAPSAAAPSAAAQADSDEVQVEDV
jgi:hypothetical protein